MILERCRNFRSGEYKKLLGIPILLGIFGLPRFGHNSMKEIDIPMITHMPSNTSLKLRNRSPVMTLGKPKELFINDDDDD